MSDVLAVTAELPQLEILEMLSREDPSKHEALALSRLPNLRTMNLSDSLPSDANYREEPRPLSRRQRRAEANFHHYRNMSVCNQAAPHIDWVREVPETYFSSDDGEEWPVYY